jgi:5-methylcytosine-specific restriction enzyme subunit McrC
LPADFPNADIYQATAYAIAAGLDGALLIYASGSGQPGSATVVNVGKRIETVTVDLAGSPEEILASIGSLARRIQAEMSRPRRGLPAPAA